METVFQYYNNAEKKQTTLDLYFNNVITAILASVYTTQIAEKSNFYGKCFIL